MTSCLKVRHAAHHERSAYASPPSRSAATVICHFLTESSRVLTGSGAQSAFVFGGIRLLIKLALPYLPSPPGVWAVVPRCRRLQDVCLFFAMYPAIPPARLEPRPSPALLITYSLFTQSLERAISGRKRGVESSCCP